MTRSTPHDHSVVVVKYGGNAMDGERCSLAEDIVHLRAVGFGVVVVHGGGPQIGALMARLGKEPKFVDGLRVTDAETLEIARMVLVGKVNGDIVRAINAVAPVAVGVSGEDAGLLLARAHHPELGFVGDVEAVEPSLLERLLADDLVPVVATIGADAEGQAYNINADTAAGAIAAALRAETLVYLTDVEGIRADADDPASLLATLSADELDTMVRTGSVSAGMVPKAVSAAKAVRSGVGRVHVVDGRVPHALLLQMFTPARFGTMVRT